MADVNFVENAYDFLKKIRLTPPTPENIDTIQNLLETIKEYREYIHPNSDSWKNYVQNVFQLFGFNITEKFNRVLVLSNFGAEKSNRAVAVFLKFNDNFTEIIPELEWSTFLMFAMNHYQVNWGLLTDGQKFRFFNQNQKFHKVYFAIDLETIIKQDKIGDFSSFYDVMSLIKGGPAVQARPVTRKPQKGTKEYDLAYHLVNKPNSIVRLFEALRSKIKSLSSRINEKYKKKYISYILNDPFCQVQIQTIQIKIWISPDINQVHDPYGLCRDVRNIGHHGTGKTEINLSSFDELDDVFDLIRQAYNHNKTLPQKLVGPKKRPARFAKREQFWTELLEKSRQRTHLHANRSPTKDHWLSTGVGKTGLSIIYAIRTENAQIELAIDSGDRNWNKNTFDYFAQHKNQIEANFGATLDWQRKDTLRGSRIAYVITDSGLMNEENWGQLQDKMIDSMIRFDAALKPFIEQLKNKPIK